jgi:hypothetical protein
MSTSLGIEDIRPWVSEAATEFGIPEDSLWRKLRAENSGSTEGALNLKTVRTDAVSPANAHGIMQLTPVALEDVINAGLMPSGLTVESLSPRDNIRAAAAYIKRLRHYSTDPAVEDAMYNYGPKARFRMDQLPQETQDYIQKSGAGSPDGLPTTPQQKLSGQDLVSLLLKGTQQQNDMMVNAGNAFTAASAEGIKKQITGIAEQKSAVLDAASNAGAKAGVEWQQNKMIEGLQQLMNMDPSQMGNEIAKNIAEVQKAREAYGPARAQFDAIGQINPLTNPLDYIFGQIQLPQVAAKVNAIADSESIAADRIRTSTELLKNAKSTLTANTSDQLLAINKAQAQIDAKIANAKLTEVEGKVQVQAANSQLQSIMLADKIGDNNRQTAVAVATIQDREDAMAARKEASDARLADKKTAAEEEARINGRLDVVSKSLGLAEPMTLRVLKTLPMKEREAWQRAAESGEFGKDLQDSVRFYLGKGARAAIIAGGGSSVYATAKKLEQDGLKFMAEAENAQAKIPGAKKLSLEEARTESYRLYQNMITESMASPTTRVDLSSSKWDHIYNPYVAPFTGFSAAIDADPTLGGMKNNIVKKSVDVLVKSGSVRGENLTAEQQQQIISAAIDNVATRAIDPRQAAAEISSFFKGAVEYNNKLNSPGSFGIPVQNSYLFSVEGSFRPHDNLKMVDLMNPTAVEQMIVQKAGARMRDQKQHDMQGLSGRRS